MGIVTLVSSGETVVLLDQNCLRVLIRCGNTGGVIVLYVDSD